MRHTHSLATQLNAYLDWHQSRIDLTALVIMGMIQICSVNLSRVARTMGHGTDIDSRRKRLKRYFAWAGMELDDIARMVVNWMAPEGNWILCLNRTNWEFGKFKINIMMLAIAYKGTAIPVIWTLLPKARISNTRERLELLERFVRLFGTDRIQYLTADREFRGEEWVKWMQRNKIPFRIRVPNNTHAMNRHRTEKLKAYRYFSLRVGESCHLNHAREVWGVKVYLPCYRSEIKPVKRLKHGRLASSLFRYGLEWLSSLLFDCISSAEQLNLHIKMFGKPCTGLEQALSEESG